MKLSLTHIVLISIATIFILSQLRLVSLAPATPEKSFIKGDADRETTDDNEGEAEAPCEDNAAGMAWIDFMTLAPRRQDLDQQLMRSLASIGDLRLDRSCRIRVFVVRDDSPNATTTQDAADLSVLTAEWSAVTEVDLKVIGSPRPEQHARLRAGIEAISRSDESSTNDILFAFDSGIVIPLEISKAIRRYARKGSLAFMPVVFDLAENSSLDVGLAGKWSPPTLESLANVGIYVSDAIACGLYSDGTSTPLRVLRKSGLNIVSPEVRGLVRPFPAPPTNEPKAYKRRMREEAGKNKRPTQKQKQKNT